MRISDWSSDVCSSDLFYVRIIERPQSTVDSNLINQRESQRIIDECCVEILVPIMGRRVLQLPIDDAIVGRGEHLHVLQRAREPIDARPGQPDPDSRLTIEPAAKDTPADEPTARP